MANLYSDLPGVGVTVADGGLSYTPPAESAGTETVLIIAPDGRESNDSYGMEELGITWINGQSAFGDNTAIGSYVLSNDIAKVWTQAINAGCKSTYASALKGGDSLEKNYIFLHDLYTALEDNTVADIIAIDSLYADDKIYIKGIKLNEDEEITVEEAGLYYVLPGEKEVEGKTIEILSGKITDPVNPRDEWTKVAAGQLFYVQGIDPVPLENTVENKITKADSNTVESDSHGLNDDDKVVIIDAGDNLNLVENTTKYYVIKTDVDKFQLALTDSTDVDQEAIALENSTVSYAKVIDPAAKRPIIPLMSRFYDNQLFEQIFDKTFAVKEYVPAADDTEGEIAASKATRTETSFVKQLAGYCSSVSSNSKQVLGIMSVKEPPNETIADIRNYVKEFENTDNHFNYNGYVQVIGGPAIKFLFNGSEYSDTWVGAYAGLISALPSYSAPTNKRIPGAIDCGYRLSRNQQLTLINAHVVPARVRGLGDIVVSDAVTTAPNNSDFVRLTTVRITRDAIELVRETADPYIGEPNSLEKRNALETQIRAGLEAMKKAGAIQQYNLIFKATTADVIKGDMRILLEFVPQFETRNIRLAISLKPSL